MYRMSRVLKTVKSLMVDYPLNCHAVVYTFCWVLKLTRCCTSGLIRVRAYVQQEKNINLYPMWVLITSPFRSSALSPVTRMGFSDADLRENAVEFFSYQIGASGLWLDSNSSISEKLIYRRRDYLNKNNMANSSKRAKSATNKTSRTDEF